MKYLVVADPVTRIQPKFDTSLRLASELLSRGIDVDWLDVTATDLLKSTESYLSSLPVQKILMADAESTPFLELGPMRTAKIDEYDVILQRKDPPVDADFRRQARHFAAAPKRILQINDPAESVAHSEHMLPTRYPAYSIPTRDALSFADFVKAVRAEKGETVSKPLDECSGNGIAFWRPDADEAQMREYWDGNADGLVLQPFQTEINKSGDLRILVFDGKVLGSVLRVPRVGSRLANLHQGASSVAFTPTARQLEAVKIVSADLAPLGLYLLGLDFIGDLLSEVNITSPSALAQINDVMKTRLEPVLVDAIEDLRKRRLVESSQRL